MAEKKVIPMMFSQNESKAKELVGSTVKLTQMAMNKHYKGNVLATEYSVVPEDYSALNRTVLDSTFKYCAEKANLGELDLDFSTPEGLQMAFSNSTFETYFFTIQRQALLSINADNEVEAALRLANVSSVGWGDSKTYEIDSKALFEVQDNSYGNNVALYQKQFKSAITVDPSPKDIGIEFDVMQLTAYDYDYGKLIAKVAMSFRTRMYKEIIDIIFDVSNVNTTPFYEPAFAKKTYTEMADRLDATNGNVGVMAYGTRSAFVSMSDNTNNGYSTQDEINKTGFIANFYGVSSMIIDQAVDSNTASFTFQVPNDRVLLLSNTGDKPVKLVKEGSIMVTNEDGRNNSLYRRTYRYFDSWGTKLATQAAYGIQEV